MLLPRPSTPPRPALLVPYRTRGATLWAKKQDENGFFKWLPLTAHLRDTRQVAGLLWEHWLSEGQKKAVVIDPNM